MIVQLSSVVVAVFFRVMLRATLWTSSLSAVAITAVHSSGVCDQVHELSAGRHPQQMSPTTNVITIDSPNYPFTQYPPRSSCRHSIRAPLGYTITVQCNMNLPAVQVVVQASSGGAGRTPDSAAMPYTTSDRCQTDFLYISAPATVPANDGYFEYFCGRGYVSRTSVFNTLTLAYESRSDTVAGYFSCTAFATRQSCDCGWNPSTKLPGSGSSDSGKARIIGGQEAVANEYAAMAALVDRRSGRVFCGGSISE